MTGSFPDFVRGPWGVMRVQDLLSEKKHRPQAPHQVRVSRMGQVYILQPDCSALERQAWVDRCFRCADQRHDVVKLSCLLSSHAAEAE